jgi:Putative beta-barrel porin-2, OmpL-like. bbp2
VTTRTSLKFTLASCSAAIAIVAAAQAASAADMPAPAPIAPVVGNFNFFDGVEYHVQGEAGILGNAANPVNGLNGAAINFGHLYTDHANEPELNQVLMTITKAVDPKATGYAFGFTAQGLYGSDMRFNHFLGLGAFAMRDDRNQIGVVQGFVAAHLPWFTKGGVDVKIGLFTSPQGYETLDPSTSPFYSHSYTYNYAVTFNHTGILTTTHINDTLDFWLGVDTGNQDTFGSTAVRVIPAAAVSPTLARDNGDPNGQPAGFVGFGLNNLANGKLTVLALSHIGAEQAPGSISPAGVALTGDPYGYKSDLRFYNDVVFTYKINDAWTAVLEGNYTHDDYGFGPTLGGPADFYSGVGYLSYTFAKIYTLNLRGEIARDNKNFYVATPLVNSGIALGEEGFGGAALSGVPGRGTTYGSITGGITIKPDVPKPFATVMLRPEVRYDNIIDGAPLYGAGVGVKRDQFTFGGDVIVGF